MSKIRLIALVICFVLCMTACSNNEEVTTDSTADYPTAIMVEDTIYLYSMEIVNQEFDDKDITGYTTSYTDTIPEKNGETNFNRELDMPYVILDAGVVVYYENAWHLCTPNDTENGTQIQDKTNVLSSENEENNSVDIEKLRENYPEYFEMADFKGIEVYV